MTPDQPEIRWHYLTECETRHECSAWPAASLCDSGVPVMLREKLV